MDQSDQGPGLARRALLRQSLAGGAVLAGAVAAKPAAAQRAVPPALGGDMVRLVIAGNNAQGKSHIIKDERVSKLRGDIWKSNPKETLGPLAPNEPAAILPTTIGPSGKSDREPEAGGTLAFFAALQPAKAPYDRAKIGGFHRTATLDYIVVMNDQVRIVFDEDDALLSAGDILILRNALHTWHNPTNTPVGIFVVQSHA